MNGFFRNCACESFGEISSQRFQTEDEHYQHLKNDGPDPVPIKVTGQTPIDFYSAGSFINVT